MTEAPLRGLSGWVVRHLPETVAINPERTMLNLGCLLIGLSSLFDGQHSPLRTLWPLAQYEWGLAMLGGGVATLVGMVKHQRTTERLGLLLILGASLFFAGFLVARFGLPGLITALIFLAIAGAKAIRLSVTAAARQQNIRLGEEMNSEQASGDDPCSP